MWRCARRVAVGLARGGTLRSVRRNEWYMRRWYGAREREYIQNLVAEKRCVLFMKGTPDNPMCGFSKAVCSILDVAGADFTAVDVLEDDGIRNEIKEFSDWPTIPQLYLSGEFVGGCDIIIDHYNKGELKEMLAKAGAMPSADNKD
eukprot:TRINITY_DN1011_c0_g1_i2.p1 TRINITY_DN1011_c0_g1~~TRINITY_DN1011_c0_g1_i2.p1  ORF type:complete len:146 (-),score=29.63 TRINITY_DN1011_c0_g1_i2:72-509(-)